NGHIIKANSKIEDMTGFSKKEILGKHVTELFTQESQEIKPFDFESVKRGEIIKNERDLIRKCGGTIPVEMLSRLMPDKTYQSFIRDMSERIDSDKALKESERSKSVLLSNLPGIAYRCHYDKKWTMEYISQGCYELTGYSQEELINNKVTSFSELIVPEYREFLWEVWKEAVKTYSPAQAEYKIITADNIEKWVWEQGVCIYDKQGNALALEGLIIDITQRKKMEQALKESEEKYRLLFEKSPLGIIHFDSHGYITGCNQILLNTLGTKAEILYGKNINILSEPQITTKANHTLNGMNEIFEGEFYSPFSHITIPLRVLFSPILSESKAIEGGIAIFENRSSQVMKENLEKQIAIAKETIKFKQNFLANMSHEIRTPLTGIIGMIDILETTKLDDFQSDYLNTIKLSAANLREIINQILDYSKIEAGRLELKTISFKSKSLLDDARNLFLALCKKDIYFETSISSDTPDYLIADKYRINQIINNLLSNAIKFTNKGVICLEQSLLKTIDNNKVLVKISVRDTGCGINPELKSKLFQPFQQADAGDTRHIEG
ncbi:MAG: PAS domain S-box protein, partial [Bacteroidales bacterium]|nr:PAS domain S-box protein [Bacteroidales bacterium]